MNAVRWAYSVIERTRLAFRVFRMGLPKEGEKASYSVEEFISGRRKPGFPCPRCKTAIVIGIPALLDGSNVSCTHCGLVLEMTWQDDLNARQALENIQSAAKKIEQARRFNG